MITADFHVHSNFPVTEGSHGGYFNQGMLVKTLLHRPYDYDYPKIYKYHLF